MFFATAKQERRLGVLGIAVQNRVKAFRSRAKAAGAPLLVAEVELIHRIAAVALERLAEVVYRGGQVVQAGLSRRQIIENLAERNHVRYGLERLKTNYEESAYLQLKAVLQPEKP